MTKFKLIKTIIYILLGILIIVFRNPLYPYVTYLVALSIFLFGLDSILEIFEEKGFNKKDIYHLVDGSILIITSLIICFVVKDFIVMCFVWGIWTILREIKELNGEIYHIIKKKYGFTSLVESIAVVVLAITLLTNPTEHHVKFHIIVLGIEFMLEVLLPIIYMLIEKRRAKKLANS